MTEDKVDLLQEITNELKVVFSQLEQSKARIKLNVEDALKSAHRIGELLTQAKSRLQHGQWLPYLKQNFSLGTTQAAKYMYLYNNWDDKIISQVAKDSFSLERINLALKTAAGKYKPRDRTSKAEAPKTEESKAEAPKTEEKLKVEIKSLKAKIDNLKSALLRKSREIDDLNRETACLKEENERLRRGRNFVKPKSKPSFSRDQIKFMKQRCHPDKSPGGDVKMANEVTAILNSLH